MKIAFFLSRFLFVLPGTLLGSDLSEPPKTLIKNNPNATNEINDMIKLVARNGLELSEFETHLKEKINEGWCINASSKFYNKYNIFVDVYAPIHEPVLKLI